MQPPAAGVVLSVNVGRPREVPARNGDGTVTTAIWKEPVEARVEVRGVNLAGDDQADRNVHGGPDKAVYAYAEEDYHWWATELGRPLGPGTFGENLTLRGVAVTDAVVGERWAVGTCELEVCQPRTPCSKLGLRMGDVSFPRRFTVAGRPGAYLRIVTEGELGVGDEVVVLHRPAHGLTVGTVPQARTRAGRALLPRLLEAPELATSWSAWAVERAIEHLQQDPEDAALRTALRARLLDEGVEAAAVDALFADLPAQGEEMGPPPG